MVFLSTVWNCFCSFDEIHDDVIKWKRFPRFRVNGPLWGVRLVTQSFDVFFDERLNKRLIKQSRRLWFETPSRPLWRHCNVDLVLFACFVLVIHVFRDLSWWLHQMETFSALLAICAKNSPVTGDFPAQRPVTRSFDVFYLHLNMGHSTVLGATFVSVKRVRPTCPSNVTFTISYLLYLIRQFAEWEAYLYDRKGADLNIKSFILPWYIIIIIKIHSRKLWMWQFLSVNIVLEF